MEQKKPYLKIIISIVIVLLAILIILGFYLYKNGMQKEGIGEKKPIIFSENSKPTIQAPKDSDVVFGTSTMPTIVAPKDSDVIFGTSTKPTIPVPQF